MTSLPILDRKIREFFKTHATDVTTVYLFGSRAREQSREESDVDIAVLLEEDPPPTFAGLCLDLEEELEGLLAKTVDLVVLNRAPPDLVYRVLRDGKLLVDHNPSARIRFEVRSRNERFDMDSGTMPSRTQKKRTMTDPELVEKKLAFIESCVRELRDLARPEQIEFDVKEERFVAHTLQMAIQAALDAASHIVSDEHLGEPATNRELFQLLTRNGWLPADVAKTMRAMAGFRNILVHGYQAVDRRILRDVAENRLDDLLVFTEAIRSRLPAA